jgi:hypothetical protein
MRQCFIDYSLKLFKIEGSFSQFFYSINLIVIKYRTRFSVSFVLQDRFQNVALEWYFDLLFFALKIINNEKKI